MKPKEQWITEYEAQRHLPRNQRTLIHSNGSYIEAVQLDAFKAGAEWAANQIDADRGILTSYILEATENLKELPK